MWAHQIIETLMLNKHIYKDAETICKFIYNAQKFYVGDIDILPKSDSTVAEIEPFAKKYAKTPYNCCLFEFTCEYEGERPHRHAFLTTMSSDGNLTCLDFAFINTWMIERIYYFRKEADIMCPKYDLAPWLDDVLDSVKYNQLVSILEERNYNYIRLLAILIFLNCKNVETERVNASQHRNKIRRDQGMVELFDYHIFKIKKTGESQPGEISGGHNRLHLCRGHFKEYTKENPLLGKHTGLYWWEPHIRGQNKKGIVMKDYLIEGGNEK